MPRTHFSLLGRTGSGLGGSDHIAMVDDDLVADMDEPPERGLYFGRKVVAPSPGPKHEPEPNIRSCRSPSLLTQGLLSSPELQPMSLDTSMTRAHSTASNGSMISSVSTAELTSDGGLTSPARTSTPSPPLPSSMHTGLAILNSKTMESLEEEPPRLVSHPTMPLERAAEPEPAPLRRRCITFACPQPKKEVEAEPKKQAPSPPRKTCLTFACPSKPQRESEDKPLSRRPLSPAPVKVAERRHRDSQSTIKGEKTEKSAKVATKVDSPTPSPADTPTPTPKPKKSKNPDGLRFHEFAAPRIEEEGWITATPTTRQKITVNDTLRKENAIRKLGEEAEEEALAEEEEEEEELNDELDELDEDDDEDEDSDEDEDDDDDLSESDGNETDNEEGFADSDDESDDGSEYAFWTPANTTAATSMEPLEHIRPRTRRSASESSIESSINTNGVPIAPPTQPVKRHVQQKSKRRHRSPRGLRPSTPELPDSTDFVCGTFDEDRPLEAAYLAMKEQRRIAKNGILPQDVDPSFPTSDPEQDDDDMDEEDEADDDEAAEAADDVDSDVPWLAGTLEVEEEATPARGRGRSNSTRQNRKSPHVSPGKRAKSPAPRAMRSKSPAPPRHKSPAPRHKSPAPPRHKSPAPPRRNKSPAPRLLFGRSPRPAPLALHHGPAPSPPSSRHNSMAEGSGSEAAMRPGRLAQRPRPNLTRTTSLPRTPNPFFVAHGTGPRRTNNRATRRPGALTRHNTAESEEAAAVDDEPLHSRGPIDIVQGLEQKRARRKEKFWRLHCRHKAQQKPARIGKGKGAERMRDVGLEMVERTRGYGVRAPLVLSV